MSAYSMTARVLFMGLMIASIFTASSNARLSNVFLAEKEPTANIMPLPTLHEFGIEVSKLEYYKRRAALMFDAGTMRVAPDGPDPQHHFKSPSSS